MQHKQIAASRKEVWYSLVPGRTSLILQLCSPAYCGSRTVDSEIEVCSLGLSRGRLRPLSLDRMQNQPSLRPHRFGMMSDRLWSILSVCVKRDRNRKRSSFPQACRLRARDTILSSWNSLSGLRAEIEHCSTYRVTSKDPNLAAELSTALDIYISQQVDRDPPPSARPRQQ